MPERRIYAAYDDEGVFVYQAFRPEIVQAALAKGTFGAGFDLARMTWIKPSFAWMLYRSGYASQPGQEAILKIRLTHAGFLTILRQSVESSYNPRQFASQAEWQAALRASDVRHQWDPERTLSLAPHPSGRRAIQIGLRGAVVQRYVHEWIIGLEEVTGLAQAIRAAVSARAPLPPVPDERLLPVDAELAHRLSMSDG